MPSGSRPMVKPNRPHMSEWDIPFDISEEEFTRQKIQDDPTGILASQLFNKIWRPGLNNLRSIPPLQGDFTPLLPLALAPNSGTSIADRMLARGGRRSQNVIDQRMMPLLREPNDKDAIESLLLRALAGGR